MPEADRTSPRRTARLVLAVIGVVLLVLALTLYAARKVIAREALTGWLNARGIASETEVTAFGLSGFTGRLRIGDPAHPDVTVENAEVRYGLRGFGVEVRSVKLTRPVVRARLHDGQLSVGALDPLIAELRKRPPQPDARKPTIEIDDGVVLLATDYGPLRIGADARVADGKLMLLTAASSPAVLKSPKLAASLGAASLTMRTRDDRVDLALDAPVLSASTGDASLTAGHLRLRATAPYPDLQKKRGDGGVVLNANLTGRTVTAAGQTLHDAQLSAAFTGTAVGWISDLTVTGAGSADLRASSAAGRAKLGPLRAAAAATNVRWTRQGGDALSAQLRLTGLVEDLTAGDLRLQAASAALSGPVRLTQGATILVLSGGASGQGGWSGLGPPTGTDSADIAAVKGAVRSFRFTAPGLTLTRSRLALTQAVTVRPQAGGEARLTPAGHGYRLAVAGGGLPRVDADIASFTLADGGATASGHVRASLSIGPLEGGDFDATGTLRIADGVRFTASRCVAVKARKLELGVNDVEVLAGRLCPDGRPTLTLANGDWSIAGRAEALAASVPFLQARLSDAAGRVELGQAAGRLYANAAITQAQVADAAPKLRFNPLRMTGRATLAREQWVADLAFATPAAVRVATAHLTHDGATGRGGVAIDTGPLAFAEAGLQPAQLWPLAEAVGSPADGQARFTGGFQWTKAGTTSSGTLDIPRLDFQSPAGRVTGLSGRIAFTSLAPITAAPGQQLAAQSVAAFAPLSNVTATFALEEKALRISGGEAAVGGGRVIVESLEVPLDAATPTRGTLRFEGVQLHDLVEASPFGERVDLDAKVSGRVPFETQGGKVRVRSGDLRAIVPGRLSIQRAALTSVQAQGQVDAPAAVAAVAAPATSTDTFTDFAYQAMENLAFDTLDAAIDTHPDGRLGVLFHVIGRHDPPTHQEIRLTLIDLIRRDFLNRKLPLPSGTGVNLTLDTTLNLDELLADYAAYQRLRGSGPVQPRP